MTAKLKKKVLQQLSNIIDPDLNKDIVSLGFVKDLALEGTNLKFTLELTTPACPVKEHFKQQAIDLLLVLNEIDKVDISFSAQAKTLNQNDPIGLKKVRNIITVSSCKGGVGKSTFTANLAAMLQMTGAKVAVFDADIHGPSQHILFDVNFDGLYQHEGLLVPLNCQGIKLMSFEYLKSQEDSAIMRGPMASKVTIDMLTQTDWGNIDYLLIDTPPGTSDIHLSLGQNLKIHANIIITTPQHLSFIDVVKGIKMFNQLAIPTIACVQNMAYYEINGKKDFLFGKGMNSQLQKLFHIKSDFNIPLNPALSTTLGIPYVTRYPKSPLTKDFSNISSFIIREIERIRFNYKKTYNYNIHDDKNISLYEDDLEINLTGYELRKKCRCAICIDEFTGAIKDTLKNTSKDISIHDAKSIGNYAFQIAWSDGHQSIFPYNKVIQTTH